MGAVPRVMLVLPSSTYRAEDFLRAARMVGAEAAIASERDQALAEQIGDDFLVVDLDRPESAAEAIAAAARRRPVDAVVAVDDDGVLIAARAAARLGLPHNPLEAVAATRDKAATRRRLGAAGLPQPAFRELGPDDDAAAVAAGLGFPVVLKPVSLQASRGVIRADGPEEAALAAARIRAILEREGRPADEPLLVERYLPGAEVAVEGLLRSGSLEVLAILDKPDPMEGPFFAETILVTPSRHPAPVQESIRAAAAAAVEALGLREGPIHAELRLDRGEPTVLEVAARSIGGLCSRSLSFGLLGTTLEAIILRQALGLPVHELDREPAASGVLMLPVPATGRLVEVLGREEALSVPGVTGLEVTAAPGRRVEALPEGDRYLGFLFAKGATPDEVESALRRAHARLEVVVE